MSCTVAHGLRPRNVNYRRQDVTTLEQIPVDVQTEAQTIVAESMDTKTENNKAAEKETDHPVENTETPKKETEKTGESRETENPTEKPMQQSIAAVEIENETISQNVQEVTSEPQNQETETAAPVELETDSAIAPTEAEPELDSKPTEEALENEAVDQKETEPELKVQDPETEAQQNEPEQELNDQEANIEPVVAQRVQANDEQSAQQEINESKPPKLAELIDQNDADITKKDVDHADDNQTSDNEIKSIVSKYFNSVPDIKSQYILNEGLAKSITHYFQNRVVALPLFHINMKIDRNLVKIPWETGPPQQTNKKGSYPYRVLPGFKI